MAKSLSEYDLIEFDRGGWSVCLYCLLNWLSKNSLVFEAKVIPAYRMLQRAIFMIIEYHRYDATSISFEVSESWDSHAALAVTWKVIFIFLEPPLLEFINVNFDGSVCGAKNDAGYIIRDLDSRLLVTRRSFLFESLILEAELRVT